MNRENNIKILNKCEEALNDVLHSLTYLSEIYEESTESYELLNSISGYPSNWLSLDEEICKLDAFRHNIIRRKHQELMSQ